MKSATVVRIPGRPKDQTKRAAITEAARKLFLKNSYEGVTMEQVAAAAGVAKMTVYGHFHDKESLFEAVVRSFTDSLIALLPTLPSGGGELEEELVRFGCFFLDMLLSPDLTSSFFRHFDLMSRNPAMAERFYQAGPGRVKATLANFLTAVAMRGDVAVTDASEAAADLTNLWVGDRQHVLALGLAQPMTAEQTERHVRRCIGVFLRAYASPNAATSCQAMRISC